jgi:116 kDa U5 small nuclear ribonucleoprotein component
MDSDLYDEFGNYIGPDLGEDDSSDEDEHKGEGRDDGGEPMEQEGDEDEEVDERAVAIPAQQIVLHEDKKYYSTAEEIYGREVEIMVQEEDAQPLTDPIVKPTKIRRFKACPLFLCPYSLLTDSPLTSGRRAPSP